MINLNLKNHRITWTPNGGVDIEDMHRKRVSYLGEPVLPDNPAKITIPPEEVPSLLEFLSSKPS